ncbi:MAG: ATP-binding protein [Epsilonproteobacteria bacterium]|nr:ATP-binding protein [Campylobacterota bacterium]
MYSFSLKLRNFLAITDADLESRSPITVIIAPNRAGKTQILLLLYSLFWSLWKDPDQAQSGIKSKLKRTFLLKKLSDLIQWEQNSCNFHLKSDLLEIHCDITQKRFLLEITNNDFKPDSAPLYIQPAGLGDYYKGIYSLRKYYPNWHLISEAITDMLSDLFILEGAESTTENKDLMELYEELFQAKYYVQKERIFIQEKKRKYGIEKSASGLKSLGWLYLSLRYNLLGSVLFLDEPEVNLHPTYIEKLALFLSKVANNKKIFITTHSDYLLESFNKIIQQEEIEIDVWEGYFQNEKVTYRSTVANKNDLIDTSSLNETYINIVKDLFEYEDDLGL